MGAAKKTRSSSLLPAWLRGLAAYLLGPGRPLTVAGLLIAGLALGAAAAFRYVYPHFAASGLYTVTQEKVIVTPKPPWIRADIRAEVFRDPSLEGPLSSLDDKLAERIGRAFSLHPWVASAKARKRPTAEVEVEVVYRRPVCMVEQPGGPLPVDIEGVLLPSDDFSPLDKKSYPCLSGVDTAPLAPAGQRWGDGRVVGGAEIAAALAEVWQPWKLERIVPSPRAPAARVEPTYQLVTRGGTRILWGLAPDSKAAGEISAAEKVARLRQYLADYGTFEGRDGPQELDVRMLPAAKEKGIGD
jgi:hypothetical protein